jgi:hypothetical protein
VLDACEQGNELLDSQNIGNFMSILATMYFQEGLSPVELVSVFVCFLVSDSFSLQRACVNFEPLKFKHKLLLSYVISLYVRQAHEI